MGKNSFHEVLSIIKKRFWQIVCLIIVNTIIAVYINYSILPEIFQAQTQILVNQKSTNKQEITFSQSESDLQLIDTYNVIIKSPAILNIVIERLDIHISAENLSKQISVSNEVNSRVVNILVENRDAEEGVLLANTIAQVFQEEIPKLMSVDNINILSRAVLGDNPIPVKPQKLLNIATTALVSLLLGIGFVMLVDVLDTTIKSEKNLEEITDIPIIGLISPIELNSGKSIKKNYRQER